jgi:arylsulfatase A-like enzyme
MKISALLAALCLPLVVGLGAEAPAKKLNVLFIIADDLNCDLGCYGHDEIQSPNIDKLAQRGVRFERAYCQYPLCSPSRSSFLTGRRPNVTGVQENPGKTMTPHFRQIIPNTTTLPQIFKENGWFSARVGKLYHYGVPNDIGTSSLDDYFSWDQVVNPRGRDRDELEKVYSLIPGQFGGTLSWLADEGQDPEQTDGIGAAEAEKLLERFKQRGQAFFLGVGFYRPHTPYVSPKKYFDLYPTSQIEVPKLSADDRSRTPAMAYLSSKKEQDALNDEQRKLVIQAYHASISFMDAQVGHVVDALDRLGLAESTVIVFTSDHGYHLGDHGLWQKMSIFDRSVHVPLIIAAPGAKGNGRPVHGVAEMVDLYPTLADLCGVKAPEYLDGKSLTPALNDPAVEVKPAAFSQVRRGQKGEGFSVRSGKWRYTEWNGGRDGAQLYDEEADPGEATNLAADPKYAGTVAELKTLLSRKESFGEPAAAPVPGKRR